MSPVRVYGSSFISQTYNKLCAPFVNKMRDTYFYKEVFRLFSEVRSLTLIMFMAGSMKSIQLLSVFVIILSLLKCVVSFNQLT